MSEHKARDAPDDAAGESFLGRWARLKARAREREAASDSGAADTPSDESPAVQRGDVSSRETAATRPADAPSHEEAVPAAGVPGSSEATEPVQLPELDQLDQDSDYSAFLTPGVDADLRKRALRKLFHSPKFNVFDGLDTYRDDFTSFPPLGDVLTADMRHQLERAAEELVARAEDTISRDPSREQPATAVTHSPAQQPPASGVTHETTPDTPTPAVTHEPTATRASTDHSADAGSPASPTDDDAEHGPA
jgi:hypothetical protein